MLPTKPLPTAFDFSLRKPSLSTDITSISVLREGHCEHFLQGHEQAMKAFFGVSPFFPLSITLRAEEPDNRFIFFL
jgi:hypothetical protein